MSTVGVMTLLDGPAREEALRLWRVFEIDFGSVGVQTFAHPNVTFGGGQCDNLVALGRQLKKLAGQLGPFDLRISGIDFFHEPEKAAFLRVEGSRRLEQVHRSVDRVLEHHCAELVGLYRPGRWIPHVTVGMGDLSQEALERAQARFSSYDRGFVQTARRIVLVRSATAGTGFEVVDQWGAGG